MNILTDSDCLALPYHALPCIASLHTVPVPSVRTYDIYYSIVYRNIIKDAVRVYGDLRLPCGNYSNSEPPRPVAVAEAAAAGSSGRIMAWASGTEHHNAQA